MGWFLKLLGLVCSKRQEKRVGRVGKSAANDADILHWKFTATMKSSTPLEWLLLHGQTAKAPSKVPRKFGTWVPVTKSWRDLGFKIKGLAPSTMPSQIGQIPLDGGEFLPFLIEYRRVVEAPDNGLSSIRLDALKDRFPNYASALETKSHRNKKKRR